MIYLYPNGIGTIGTWARIKDDAIAGAKLAEKLDFDTLASTRNHGEQAATASFRTAAGEYTNFAVSRFDPCKYCVCVGKI